MWGHEVKKLYDSHWTEQYVVCLYWTIMTMTTIGFGDVVPRNTWEVSISIVVLLLGGVFFSFMVANMDDLVSRVNPRKRRHDQRMQSWETFFWREKVPSRLANEIRTYEETVHKKNVTMLPDYARHQMSKTLLRNVTAYLYRHVLNRLPVFKGIDGACLTEVRCLSLSFFSSSCI